MARYKYIVKENKITPGDVLVLTLVPKRRKDVFKFKPGQYAMLSFKTSSGKLFLDHPFSIASSPTQRGYIQFGIKIFGNFTQNLSHLAPGTEVKVTGPFGKFIFKERKHKNIVHLTGGIGITPFISAVRYTTDKNLANKITMLYSSRSTTTATFLNELKELEQRNSNFKPVFAITDEDVSDSDANTEKGFIDKTMIKKHVGPLRGKTFMLCGPPRFMQAMENNLKELGVPKRLILQEAFSTTPTLPFWENFKNLFSVYGLTIFLFIFFLNFVYQEENKQNYVELSANKDTDIINTLNRITAERMAGILDLKNQTNVLVNKSNIEKQLEIEKTSFKQEAVKQQNPTIIPTPTIVIEEPTPYVAPTPKPRTRVS